MKQLFAIMILTGMASIPAIAQFNYDGDPDESLWYQRQMSKAAQNDQLYDYVAGGRDAFVYPPTKPQEDAFGRGLDEANERARREYERKLNRGRNRNQPILTDTDRRRQAEIKRQRQEKLKRQREERERRRRAEQERRERRFQQILAEEQRKADIEKAKYAEQIHYIDSQDLSAVDGNEMMGNALRGGRAMTASNYGSTVKRRRQGSADGTNEINPFNPRKPYRPTQSTLNAPDGWPSGFRLDPNAKVRIPLDPENNIRRIMALENIQEEYDRQLRAGMFTKVDTAFIQRYNIVKESVGDNFDMANSIMYDLFGDSPDRIDIDERSGEFIFYTKDSKQTFILAKDGSSFRVYAHNVDDMDSKFLDKASVNVGIASASYNTYDNSLSGQIQKGFPTRQNSAKQNDDIPIGVTADIASAKSSSARMEGYGYITKGGKSAVFSKVEESTALNVSASGKATSSGAELGVGASAYLGKNNSVTDYKMDDDGICRATEVSADRGFNPQLKIGTSVKWGGDAKGASGKFGPVSLGIGVSRKSDGTKTTTSATAKGSLLFSISGTYTYTTIDSNKINSSLNLNVLDNQKI